MAEVLDTTSCRRVELDEALASPSEFCRVLQFAGGERVSNRAMLWPAAIPDVSALHDVQQPGAVTPDVDVHFVNEAMVGGFAGSVVKDGRYFYSDSSYPLYVKYFIDQGMFEPFWQVNSRLETMRLEDPVFIITHFNPIYGHWLLEIFPKLFGIAELGKAGFRAPILLPLSMPAYVRATIELVLPGQDVVSFDHTTTTISARSIVFPGTMNKDYVYNPCFRTALEAFKNSLGGKPGPERVYISRSGMRGKFRELGNLNALDQAAERLGLTVVRPEEMPWDDQVRTLRSARLIVGEYGSGMHNALFCPPGAKVVCLNVLNNVQSRLANSFEHDVGYILDHEREASRYQPGWTETQVYTIDVDEFEDKVGGLIG